MNPAVSGFRPLVDIEKGENAYRRIGRFRIIIPSGCYRFLNFIIVYVHAFLSTVVANSRANAYRLIAHRLEILNYFNDLKISILISFCLTLFILDFFGLVCVYKGICRRQNRTHYHNPYKHLREREEKKQLSQMK